MNKIKATFYACLFILTNAVFALNPPAPIKGSASFITGKQFVTTAGQTTFSLKLPEGWGVGEMSALPNSTSHFTIFPAKGGYGGSIQVDRFNQPNEEVSRLRQTFSKITDMPDGFEVTFPKAWYACRVQGMYVIQIWYSLPKATQKPPIWDQFKQCLSVTETNQQISQAPEKWEPITEIPFRGWACNHPNKKLHVLVRSNPIDFAKPSENMDKKHVLQVGSSFGSGFFYIKWDQEKLDTQEPFAAHLKEMEDDLFSFEKSQRFESSCQYDLTGGFASRIGYPYTILSVSGDGFLFGFALKSTKDWRALEFNDFVRRINWWEDEQN